MQFLYYLIAISLGALIAPHSSFASGDLCPQSLGGIRIGRFIGIGPLGNTGSDTNPAVCGFDDVFVNTISQIMGLMTAIGVLWFLFQLFMGAIAWIGAGSDKQALDNAKKKITNAIVGVVIVAAAYSFLGVVGYFLGIDILNLKGMIQALDPTK